MRKGYSIEKLHFLGGLLPGIEWKVIAPSKHEYRITRCNDYGRNYLYGLQYLEKGSTTPSTIVGTYDGLTTREDAIKVIYSLEQHGDFNSILDMIHFTETLDF